MKIGGKDLESLAVEILRDGNRLRFRATGDSMLPFIRQGDILEVAPCSEGDIRVGDVVLYRHQPGILIAHRVRKVLDNGGQLIIQGDRLGVQDGQVAYEQVLGKVVAVDRGNRLININTESQRIKTLLLLQLRFVYHDVVGWFKATWRRLVF